MEDDLTEKVAFWTILVSKVIVWVLSVVAIYWIILKLTNHSPTTEQVSMVVGGIITGGYVALIGLVMHAISRMNKHIGKSDHFMHYSEKRFEAIGRRFDKVDERFQRVDDRFQRMDERLASIERKMDERFARMEGKIDRLLMCKNYKPGKASA